MSTAARAMLACIATALAGNADCLGQAVLRVLEPEAGASQSSATAVSGDGRAVIGFCVREVGPNSFLSRGVRWVDDAGPSDMGTFSYVSALGFSPTCASFDGSLVTGWVTWRSGPGPAGYRYAAFRWNSSTGFDNLDSLGAHRLTDVYAYGMTADGAIVVGTSGTAPVAGSPTRAVLWSTGAPQDLGTLPGMAYSSARGVDGGGAVIVGWSGNDINSEHAFRATRQTGEWLLHDMGVLPGARSSEAFGVSGDGRVVVGRSFFGDWTQLNGHAFRWTAAAGMEDLGTLPGQTLATALATNHNGSVIVGYLTHPSPLVDFSAFMWRRDLGMVDLNDYLPSRGIDLTGWVIEYAPVVSSDGSLIAGWGRLNGEVRGWSARVPVLCGSADFNHDGDSATDADIEAFFSCLAGACCATCESADFDGDGTLGTDADIEAFFRVLAGGTC